MFAKTETIQNKSKNCVFAIFCPRLSLIFDNLGLTLTKQIIQAFFVLYSVCTNFAIVIIIDTKIKNFTDMNNFQDLVVNRRSIRKYTDQELNGDNVKKILESALISPSSKSKMPWEFVVVEDKNVLTQLKECKQFGTKPLESCPLAVVVCADPTVSDVWIEDASVAAFMIQLQTADFGLGSCWVQVRDRFMENGDPSEEYVRNILNIPDHIRVLCIVTLGYKDEDRKPYDLSKNKWEKIHIGQW